MARKTRDAILKKNTEPQKTDAEYAAEAYAILSALVDQMNEMYAERKLEVNFGIMNNPPPVRIGRFVVTRAVEVPQLQEKESQ